MSSDGDRLPSHWAIEEGLGVGGQRPENKDGRLISLESLKVKKNGGWGHYFCSQIQFKCESYKLSFKYFIDLTPTPQKKKNHYNSVFILNVFEYVSEKWLQFIYCCCGRGKVVIKIKHSGGKKLRYLWCTVLYVLCAKNQSQVCKCSLYSNIPLCMTQMLDVSARWRPRIHPEYKIYKNFVFLFCLIDKKKKKKDNNCASDTAKSFETHTKKSLAKI